MARRLGTTPTRQGPTHQFVDRCPPPTRHGLPPLAYLRRFPIDAIKIDRRFVAGLGVDTDDTTIVEAIVRMASGLRLDVVAEGIETREQLLILSAMGCPGGQGYLWSRPVAPDGVAPLLGLATVSSVVTLSPGLRPRASRARSA